MPKSKTEINPVSIERVKQVINESGMTQKDFAKKVLFYEQQTLSKIVNGKAPLTRESAARIAQYFEDINAAWLMGESDCKTEMQAFLLTNCDRLNKRETEWGKMLRDFNYADRQIKALELILYNQGFSLELSGKSEYIIFETDNRDSVLATFTHSEIDQLLKRMARQTMSEITWLDEDKRKERKAHENMKYFFNQEEHNG